jgi:hypothetical protein
MSKVKNIVILGVGYVLGAKAGRARYEQLKQQATRVAEHPRTQQLAHTAREQVVTRLPGSVTERLPQSLSSRRGTVPSTSPSSSSVGYPAGEAARPGQL